MDAGPDSLAARSSELDRERAGFWRRFVAAFVDGLVLGVVSFVVTLAAGDSGSLLAVLADVGYFTYFHGRTGQTPGDAALGIRLVDLGGGTGGPIGYARAALRWFISIFSALVLLIGYLWMLWDGEKQTWHDKAASSVVVKLAYA